MYCIVYDSNMNFFVIPVERLQQWNDLIENETYDYEMERPQWARPISDSHSVHFTKYSFV